MSPFEGMQAWLIPLPIVYLTRFLGASTAKRLRLILHTNP